LPPVADQPSVQGREGRPWRRVSGRGSARQAAAWSRRESERRPTGGMAGVAAEVSAWREGRAVGYARHHCRVLVTELRCSLFHASPNASKDGFIFVYDWISE
jgi:hypothetical protein